MYKKSTKKLTTEIFVSRAIEVHKDSYDYSEVIYKNDKSKVIINCRKHGTFEQTPNNHLKGKGCPICATNRVSNTQELFVENARIAHGNIYNYDKVIYKNNIKKVIIACSIHGDFEQRPSNHISGQGCSKCTRNPHWTRQQYIKKAKGRLCIFYTLRCFEEIEEFYKIGITMETIRKRYNNITKMPYSYEIVAEIHGEAGFIWDLEKEEKRKLKVFNYQPKIKFGGSKTECFTKHKI